MKCHSHLPQCSPVRGSTRFQLLQKLTGAMMLMISTLSFGQLPPLPDAELEFIAELKQGPGNIAVTPEGRIIISNHQFYDPQYRVVELLPNGKTRPFPNEAWSSEPDENGIGMHAVLGLRSDPQGVVWMLDNGGDVPKVVAWDTRNNLLERVIYIPAPATRPGSLHNDLAVDPINNALYLADIGGDNGPAIVVVDLDTGISRRVLEGHTSVHAEDMPMVIEGRTVRLKNADGEIIEGRIGLNPITLDPTYTWVYYAAMNSDDLWRIRTRDLLNTSLTANEIAEKVERYGEKPLSDGISIDNGGHVYITDVVNNAIGVTGPSGSYRIYARHKNLLWPDGISAGADGWMYVTVNKLHRSATLNGGEDLSKPPYYIVRFRAISESIPGR